MKRTYFSLLLLLAAAGQVFSQEAQETKNKADQMLRSNGTVNPSTLSLEMSIPLGGYQGRGITLPLGLNYSSKLWRLEAEAVWVTPSTGGAGGPGGGGEDLPEFGHTWTYAAAKYAEDSASGWTSSISQPYIEYTGTYTSYNNIGTPNVYEYWQPACNPALGPCPSGDYFIKRITVRLPDASYELRAGDGQVTNYSSTDGEYLSVDGSGVKYVQNSAAFLYRLYMPDGSYYDFKDQTEEKSSTDYHDVRRARKLVDPHGNYVTFNDPNPNDPDDNGSITDTLGRTFPVVVPREGPQIPENEEFLEQTYTLPGMSSPYVFRWERLEEAFGHPGYVLRYKGHSKRMYPSPVYGNSLFEGDQMSECSADRLLVTVDWDYQQNAPLLFNPAVLTEITLPNGAKYEFLYNEYGEIERINYPAGGYEEYTHQQVASLAQLSTPYQVVNRGVVERKVYERDGTTPSTWTYEADSSKNRYRTKVYAPDGTKTERFMHRGVPPPECYQHEPGGFPANTYGLWWGYDNVLSGRPYEERVFNSSNHIVQKTITKWDRAESEDEVLMTISPERLVQLNPRTTWTQTTTYDGDVGVAAATKLEYHDGFDDPGSPLNVRYKKEYAYEVVNDGDETVFNQMPLPDPEPTFTDPTTGTPVRKTETTFKTDTDYLNRNMLRLPIEVKVMDGQSNVKAKTQTAYDETTPLADGSGYTIPGWSDPQTNVRGLATSTKSWFNVNNANDYVQTQVQYNRFGGPRKTWDGNNKLSQIEYDDCFYDINNPSVCVNQYTYAYPTKTISPIPGGNGSTSELETHTQYWLDPGLPTRTTDVNGQHTYLSYRDPITNVLDPLLRLRKVTASNGQQTIAEYGAGTTAATRWLKTREQLDANSWQENVTWYDGLFRTVKTQELDAVSGDVFVDTEYDNMFRVKKVSNPYRTGDTLYWTENTFDALGRITKVKTTGDQAEVNAAYSVATTGNQIGTVETVTDEAGKPKRMIEDAFDNLIRVDEPDNNGGLGTISNPYQPTVYSYDTNENLTTIVQGGQTRSFTYDALNRLTQATNPESGIFQFSYDANGNLLVKTDARGITTTHSYDALNRVNLRNYSDATPDVSFYYDGTGIQNSKSRLTKVSSSVSETQYNSFDANGNILTSQQITDGQIYGFTYTYNLDGDLLSQTYPSGKLVETYYDPTGDIDRVTRQIGNTEFAYASHFEYAPDGEVKLVRFGNTNWESTLFNSRRQITQIGLGYSANDTGIWKTNYEYGDWAGQTLDTQKNNGSLARQTITVPTIANVAGFTAVQAYTYDKIDRLKSATETVGGNQTWKQTFLYDRFGNKNYDTSNTTTLGSCPSAVCNPTASQTTNKLTGYGYDPAGNITTGAENRTFTYDAENRQITASGNNLSSSYDYDGNGKRVSSRNSNTDQTTIFVYEASGRLAAEYTINVPAPEIPVISYFTEDALDSPRVITTSFGDVKARRDFYPFGEETYSGVGPRTTAQSYSASADDTRIKFATYQRDNETGLDFAQSRYYSSMHGRFTSPDEFKGGPDELFDFAEHASSNPTFYAELTNPQSLNKFQYSYNNPYKFNDPLGHCPIPPWSCAVQRAGPLLDRLASNAEKIIKASGIAAAAGAAYEAVKAGTEVTPNGNLGSGDCPSCDRNLRAAQQRFENQNRQAQNAPSPPQNRPTGQAAGSSGSGGKKPRASERRQRDRARTAANKNSEKNRAKKYNPAGRSRIKTGEDATDQREDIEAAARKNRGIESTKKSRDREIQKQKEDYERRKKPE
jgi:RHS repeat-associated protein